MAFLELNHVKKRFIQFVAVHSFDLQVEQGEFVSFLGPSGCGKTTTLRMIAGFETPTEGEIRINGADISHIPPNRRNVGMVFQSYALFPNMTVKENIGFGLKVAGKTAGNIQQRVNEMLELIHMETLGDRYPYQISGGQQQRVALARALAIQPQVLLLDEPLSALDAKIRVRLRNEIRAIQRQLGITTIYVTHDQEEALSLSDRVVVMNEGRIEQIGSPFSIYNFPATPFVASFIGMLNVISAYVSKPAEGRVRIEDQEIRASEPVKQPAGQKIMLALRPEMLSLHNGNPGDNRLTGRLENIIFLGSIVRLVVRVGAHEISMDTFNNPNLVLPKIGETVSVFFSAEACLIINTAPGA
jgi:putative spermidine/putrescine transport system ATP-binding protein